MADVILVAEFIGTENMMGTTLTHLGFQTRTIVSFFPIMCAIYNYIL